MKQLLILSGKGGTGKTTVAGALIAMSGGHAFADCDVDAPNLHLLMPGLPVPEKSDYYGLEKASIDPEICTRCGLCGQHCAFGAIRDFTVGEFECEGCGVCAEICPVQAITLRKYASGNLMLYRNGERIFSTAQLWMGAGASGRLVTAVKQRLAQEAPAAELAIIDGSPGIGCPVIASVSGANFVLLVAEPTVSGIHDLQRIVETVKRFGVACAVCVNKFDVDMRATEEIERRCESWSVPAVGRIPYDPAVVEAVNACCSIAEYPDSPAAKAIAGIWDTIRCSLTGINGTQKA